MMHNIIQPKKIDIYIRVQIINFNVYFICVIWDLSLLGKLQQSKLYNPHDYKIS